MTRLTSLSLAVAAVIATALTFIPLALTFAGAASSAELRMVCADSESMADEATAAARIGQMEILTEAETKRWLAVVNAAEPVSRWDADQVMVVTVPDKGTFAMLLFTSHGMGCGPMGVQAPLAKAALDAAKGQGTVALRHILEPEACQNLD
jgi:hypothetical protein